MSTAQKTKPALWSGIVSRVKSGSKGGDAGEWSARKAQLAVGLYKKSGGGTSSSPSSPFGQLYKASQGDSNLAKLSK